MHKQVLYRCMTCQNVWSDSKLYERDEEFVDEQAKCPLCQGKNTVLIADTMES